MASGTRAKCLKVLETDSVSKGKARKSKKLIAPSPSPSKNKMETKGKKVPESPVTRSARKDSGASTSMCTDSQKCATLISKQKKKEAGRTRSTSTFDKSNKTASTPTKRKREDNRNVSSSSNNSSRTASLQTKKRKVDDLTRSSSSNNSIRSASPPTRKRKVDDLHRVPQVTSSKSEENGKKVARKHLHVRTYIKLITKGANKVGDRDDREACVKEKCPSQRVSPSSSGRVSKEAQEDVGLQVQRETKVKASEPLEKEELNNVDSLAGTPVTNSSPSGVNPKGSSKFGGCKDKKAPSSRKSNVLVKKSEKEITNHDGSPTNTKPSPLTTKELGVCDDGISEPECCGTTTQPSAERNTDTTTQQIAERNTSEDPEKCTAQTGAALPDLCLVCKQTGLLMCCGGKGCKKSYHLSCLDPPLNDVPPGVWLCNDCVEKRMKSGIYSVSGGIESVWDVDEGTQSGKRYFVKYKGLSHLHNRWVPENQLLVEVPSLFAKISKKNQKEKVKKWRKEWAEPERLLQKRFLGIRKVADRSTSSVNSSHFCVEWFVKWKGLGYDQATWELENSLRSCSAEVVKLIEDFQYRCVQAKRSYEPLRVDQALQVKQDPFCDLSKLPEGCPAELDMDHLNSMNRLREFWHKSKNAVLIDDQERISKSVLFLLSLQSYACRPSLIITTSGTIPLWEAEFARLAPSLSVIMYLGSKDTRKMIQKLEFYEESGCLMLQVLLSDPDAIVEDLGDLACIGWEAVLVDECQNSKISSYLEQFKSLNAGFKVLLFNGQLKGSLSQFLNFLSFIGTGAENDGLSISNLDNGQTVDLISNLREKLMCYVAYERKADSSKFLEYWVPVPLSNVQLEEYCETLISNSDVLRSNSRSDLVGTIHDVLMATKRCCDHPYLVDGELRNSLTKGLQGMDYFNAEVHASGKLLLLEKILQEMKGRGLRVVIIYQSVGGPVKISLGDILDDFLQQRFGVDSYERIETRLIMSKKLTAQNMFNDRKTGRFVFLIESRACLPSVKLYSVDVVILFNSDWNPFSDVRGLQKITFQPQSTSIRVFRLYTSFTVEEKLLILAKHDTPIESNIQSTSRNVAHSLLAWGASNLFQKLDGFHLNARTTCISVTSSDVVNLLNDVTSEILEEVHGEAQTNRKVPCFLNKVSRSGASYSKSIVLVGEKEGVLVPDKDIPSFWSSLLEGRHPKWLYISKPSQRIRRKIYNLDESMNVHEAENDEVKKRRKINSIGDPFTSVTCSQERRDAVKDAISETRKSHLLESQPWEPKLEEQRTLLMLLRPELAKLCDILNLQGTVKSMAEEFLEYIMNNHDVSSKQVPVLQALKISLCWRAASMLRHNLDRLESLALARRHLDYECTEHEAFSVYSRLRILKEKFPCQAVVLKDVKAHNTLNSHPEKADAAKEALHGRDTEVAASDTPDLGVTERVSDGKFQTNQESDAVLQTNEKFQSDIRSSKDQLYDRLRDLIDKVCIRRSKELAQVHQAELVQYESQMNEEKWKLENAHNLDVELVRSIHTDATVIKDKVMLLTLQFSRKMGRFHRHVKQQREKLICMQFDMKINEQDLKKKWLENAKAGQLEGSFNDVPLPVTGFMAENMKETSELAITCSSGITVLSTVGSSDQTNTYVDGAPTGTSNGLEERCPIQSNIENLMLEPEALASQPGTLDYLATTTQNRVVEKSGTPFELEDVLPMDIEVPAHQPEFPNPLSGVPDDLITDSIMLPDKNAENGGPTIAAASRNNQELSSFPEVTIPISQATTLSLQDEPSPNGATALEPTLHLLPQTEHDVRVPPASNPEDLACLRANCSSEQHEVPEQQAFLADSIRGEQLNEQNNVPPFDSMDDPPPQRLPSETLRSTDIQSDPRNQFSQSFPSMGWVPPQAICADPFQNELYRIHKQDDSCTKKHDEKKIQLQLEYEEEMAKVRRKYDTLLQDAERDYLREKQIIVSIYDKVLLHKVLAEELRVKFYCNKEGTSSFQGSNQNLIQQLQASASLSQPQLAVRPSSAPPPVPSLTATAHPQVLTTNQLSTSSFLTTSRPSNPPPALATFQSTGPSCQSSPLLSSNIARGSSPRAILPIGRAPAPHLQRFRPHVAVPALNSPLSAFGPVTAPVPFIPLSNVVSSLPTAFPPIQSSFSHGQLPQFIVADLLDSLPSSLASTMTNSRPIASSDFIYLSDDE